RTFKKPHNPVSTERGQGHLAGDAGVIPAVLGGDSEVLDLGRRKRIFTRAQRLALLERDGGCAKCHAPPEHCEAHHIDWWDNGGTTDLANGVMLCTRCHHDIHRHGWNIRVQAGRVEFIPPPTIDPTRQPQPGGLAALEVLPDEADDVGDTGDAGSHDDHDPPGNPGENSAHNATDRDNPARQRARHPKRHAA
ncbi:HNH endonuclease signature motif containing protein, partial [Demequina sp.]|uniref:HNH endonuclease n=1 Tax=Demequina sp. TaxID=2050685 RepID=UPI0025BF1D36